MSTIAPLKILKASAGSGKTFTLTIHYISLLLNNENSYREILAVTFTNKATAEMKERILSVLRGLALGDTSPKIDAFRQVLLQENKRWKDNDIQQKSYRVYRRIIHDYSRFTISTIDGFSQKVIRSFTYELNLDAAYKIEMNTNKVKNDLTIMLNQLLDEKPDLLDWIIDFAEKKINNNENWNYRNELSKLAGLIFTENFQEFNAAISSADDKHIFNLLNREIETKTLEFIDSIKEIISIFRETFNALGVEPDDLKGKSRNKLISVSKISPHVQKLSVSELNTTIDKYIALIDNDEAFTGADKNSREDLKQALIPILKRFADIKLLFPTFVAYQTVKGNLYYLRLLKEMSDLLSTWRKENSAQLISDSQILLNKLGLDSNNDPTFVWEKIGNRYNYFLFDEFQDTSRIQWKNYSPLLLNALSNTQNKQNEHLIVGDVKQSIYRWRNGDWRILLQQVEEQVTNAFNLRGAADRNLFIENGVLETNFRSLPNIIRFNNFLFEKIPLHLQNILNDRINTDLSEEGIRWWRQQQNDTMLIRAYENSAQKVPENKLKNQEKQGSIEVEYFTVNDSRFRANQVMEQAIEKMCLKINEWISSGRYEPKQIGILVRSNGQASMVIQKLMEHKNETGVQFDVISGDALSLSSNYAVRLLIETLKAIAFSSDKHAIHHAKMAYLYQLITTQTLFDPQKWLLFKNNEIQQLASILPDELLTKWSEWQKLPLVHLVEKLIEIYGFTSLGNIHLPYILHFKDVIGNYTANGERGINQFLEFWEEDGDKITLPSSDNINAIEVLTIHKSKGLAYDVVVIPFCSWSIDGMINGDFWIDTNDSPFGMLGKIPVKYNSNIANSIFYKQYYEEMLFNYMDALNTLYVATTRAVEYIYITAPGFKEAVDKKTGEVTGLDIKNEIISDVLYQVLSHEQSPFKLEENKLCINQEIKHKSQTKESNENTIALQYYPISNALETALEKQSRRNINLILSMEKAAQYGIMAHEVMSQVTKQDEIPTIIDRFVEDGICPLNEKNTLLQEINQIWNHPQINKWLSSNYKIWNEAAIITAEGKTLRPDKVFSNEEETIILDFKFTGDNYIEHKAQVDLYMKALQNLGYDNVKGYLYYSKVNELTQVK